MRLSGRRSLAAAVPTPTVILREQVKRSDRVLSASVLVLAITSYVVGLRMRGRLSCQSGTPEIDRSVPVCSSTITWATK